MDWSINLPLCNKLHWGINLPVFNKYTGVLTSSPCLAKYTGAFICLRLTNKRLKYLLLSNKSIYVILYQYYGN